MHVQSCLMVRSLFIIPNVASHILIENPTPKELSQNLIISIRIINKILNSDLELIKTEYIKFTVCTFKIRWPSKSTAVFLEKLEMKQELSLFNLNASYRSPPICLLWITAHLLLLIKVCINGIPKHCMDSRECRIKKCRIYFRTTRIFSWCTIA